MTIEVFYIAECPHHRPAVERVRAALHSLALTETVREVEIRSQAEAEERRFLGSPTIHVNGRDIEPEARAETHFGLGCRSYLEGGRRSGLPSEALIRRALEEDAAHPSSSERPPARPSDGAEYGVLMAGGATAILASTCCLGPLLLVTLGFSGAWIGNLTSLEPYRPWFLGATLLALAFASRRLFGARENCQPGTLCARRGPRRAYKALFGIVAALAIVGLIFPYFARLFY